MLFSFIRHRGRRSIEPFPDRCWIMSRLVELMHCLLANRAWVPLPAGPLQFLNRPVRSVHDVFNNLTYRAFSAPFLVFSTVATLFPTIQPIPFVLGSPVIFSSVEIKLRVNDVGKPFRAIRATKSRRSSSLTDFLLRIIVKPISGTPFVIRNPFDHVRLHRIPVNVPY
jgi:hypothetical protein